MTIQFTNNAATTLASGITNVATSLTVASGTGTLFPTPSGALFFYATLQSATNSAIREIVKVTARTTDTFTIVRGQDGTSGTAFSTGDKVELRVTAADLNNFGQLDTANTWASGQVFVAPVLGTPASGLLTNCTGYTYANLTGTVPTWNQNTTGTAASLSAVLSASLGGTGVAGTLTGVLYGNGTGAHTVATTAQMLAGVGTVPIANGGTNSTATPTAGGIGYGTGTAHAYTAAGTTGQVLTSQGAGAPIWASASGGGIAGIGGQVFTASGTFTIPTGVTLLKVTVVGGGGAGGSGVTNSCSTGGSGGGGGAGGASIKYLTGLTPGNTLTVTRGAAGSTSSVSSGTQTITTISATGGGGGGSASTGSGFGGSGGVGGSGSGGDINLTGNAGNTGNFVSVAAGNGLSGGTGGGSIFGGAGAGSSSNVGSNGNNYGAGGGGGFGNFNQSYSGGSGSGGIVVFEW